VFRHLHALSLRFHLERQTGGMTRDIERGTRGVHSLISLFALQHRAHPDWRWRWCSTLLAVQVRCPALPGSRWRALVVYIAFTVTVTEWRTQFRTQMNELDSTAHSQRHRFAAELRDGQVLQQRRLRSAGATTKAWSACRRAPSKSQTHAEPAQHRATAHHRQCAGHHAVACYPRRGGRAHDAG